MNKMRFGVLALAFLCLPSAAAAAPIDRVTVDAEAKTLTISGSNIKNDSGLISVEVLKDGAAWRRDLTSDESVLCVDEFDAENKDDSILNYLSFFDTAELDKDGAYTVVVKDYDTDGSPEVRVRYGSRQIFYYSQRSVDAINAAQTVQELENSVMADAYVAEQIKSEYEALGSGEQEIFWNLLLEYRRKNGDFEDLAQIVDVAKEQMCFSKLHAAKDKSDFDAFLRQCEVYGIADSNSYDLYFGTGVFDDGQMCTAQKDALAAEMLADRAKYTTIDGFVKDFWDKAVLFACNGNDSKYSVCQVLNNSDRLDKSVIADFAKKTQSQQLEISLQINLTASRYATITDLTNAVKNAHTDNGGTTNGGGTGGGGKKSGGKTAGTVSGGVPTITEPDVQLPDFEDMDSAPWAKEAVKELRRRGIISGRDDKHFAPDESVTREEFVKLLVAAMGWYDVNAAATFADADSTAWYYPYIASAQKKGIVKGNADGTFGVGSPISRRETAVILARCASGGNVPEGGKVDFADANLIGDWAMDSVAYVRDNGIMVGVSDSEFAPLAEVSRAQAAKAIYELINRR